ncbi:hypothetical protein [Moraxella lacunata]
MYDKENAANDYDEWQSDDEHNDHVVFVPNIGIGAGSGLGGIGGWGGR